MALESDTFTGPAWAASALVNGDDSGVESRDDKRALRWLRAWLRWAYGPGASVVDCDDDGFRRDTWPLIRPPKLLSLPSIGLGGDSCRYTVLYAVHDGVAT